MLVEIGQPEAGFSDIRFRRNFDQLLQMDPEADIKYIRELEVEIRRLLRLRKPGYIDSEQPISGHDWILSQITDGFSNTITVMDPIIVETDSPSEKLEGLLLLYTGKRFPA